LASGAEQKLGGKAEAMPHNLVSKKPRGVELTTPLPCSPKREDEHFLIEE
jgi:hypothetical protein